VVADLLRRMGAQPALADDLTQDALIAALKAVATYRGEGAVRRLGHAHRCPAST
jgi:RNA polymerase sigma-70 factor (ECF subfamily)